MVLDKVTKIIHNLMVDLRTTVNTINDEETRLRIVKILNEYRGQLEKLDHEIENQRKNH
jgi:hypothetical protein